jgi:hypothetical protein
MKTLIRRFFLERKLRAIQLQLNAIREERIMLKDLEGRLKKQNGDTRVKILDTYIAARKNNA